MSESNPLAGLTADQADEAIQRLADKIDQLQDTIKVARDELKNLKAARKDLRDPDPAGNGTKVDAGTAEVSAEVNS